MAVDGTTQAQLETGEYVVNVRDVVSATERQLNAWHERQAALAAVRERDDAANRERLEVARNNMELLLRDDGCDCE